MSRPGEQIFTIFISLQNDEFNSRFHMVINIKQHGRATHIQSTLPKSNLLGLKK